MKPGALGIGVVALGLAVGCGPSADGDAPAGGEGGVTMQSAMQGTDVEIIAEAESAAPPAVTDGAAIRTMDGRMVREGTNGWTCYPGTSATGPMCNQREWDDLLAAYMKREPPDVKAFSVSYMLAGEGDALGVSNTDPFATEPTADNDWVKEGPHLMIAVPDPAVLEGLPTDPSRPVYVMWKGTPYAHIMVKVADEP